MTLRAQAVMDHQALVHNFNVVRELVGPHVAIMPMVKADAYGHGLLQVAHTLKQANAFGVATLNAAITLRDSGIGAPILVMSGFCHPDEIALFSQYQLTAVVHHPDQVNWLLNSNVSALPVWVKCDTGMRRLGLLPEDFLAAYAQLDASAACVISGVMTHLADTAGSAAFTKRQLDCFETLTSGLRCQKSVVSSAGILSLPHAYYDLVRPGLMLYGVSPLPNQTGRELGLQPVMDFRSRLVSYKTIAEGDCVGYGCSWVAPRDMQIGTVSVGYGDGYPWFASLKNSVPVRVRGQLCPLIGRVSMDLLAVDLTPLSSVSLGDEVILWGKDLPIEHIAEAVGTIPYDLMCQLTARVTKTAQLTA